MYYFYRYHEAAPDAKNRLTAKKTSMGGAVMHLPAAAKKGATKEFKEHAGSER